jgi:hypothetical protein
VGDPVLDRLRKLVALDRALIEIGEPGVLERRPEELASLEARLFGAPPAGADATSPAPGGPAAGGAAGPAVASEGPPALRVLDGARGDGAPSGAPSAAERSRRRALRTRLRLIRGGQQR